MHVKLASAVALGVALLGSSAFASPNLVTNGDFNSTSYTVNHQFGSGGAVPTSQGGAQGVDGWTGNDGYNLWFTGTANATTQSAISEYGGGKEDLWAVTTDPAGGAFVALDGEQTQGVQGGISQTVSGLTVGQTYSLTFTWAAGQLQSRTGATTEQVQASLGGQTQVTSVVNNLSQGFNGWFSQTFTYTATATQEVLAFLSIGTPNGLPPIALLDGVSLVQVPEPMSMGLLGAGVAGLFLARRRQAKRTA